MCKINIYWVHEVDVIEYPKKVTDNLVKYSIDFISWLSNENNCHGYWTKDCEGNNALCFGTKAFIDWLNGFILNNNASKAIIVELDSQNIDASLPKLYF